MNAVTILAHRRPEYLRQTLDALARCEDLEHWRVVVAMDRPDPETRAVVAARAGPFGWERAILDLANAGDAPYARISRATLLTLALGFATAPYVVHLEEDCVPEPDLLTWHAEQAERYAADKRVFTVNAWSGPVGSRHDSDHLAQAFTPWGFATWADRFAEMRDGWDMQFWDRHLNERMRGGRYGLFAATSKVRNIGRVGTQPTAEWDARELVAR